MNEKCSENVFKFLWAMLSPNSDSVIDSCQGISVEMDLAKELSYVRPPAATLLVSPLFPDSSLFSPICTYQYESQILFTAFFTPLSRISKYYSGVLSAFSFQIYSAPIATCHSLAMVSHSGYLKCLCVGFTVMTSWTLPHALSFTLLRQKGKIEWIKAQGLR